MRLHCWCWLLALPVLAVAQVETTEPAPPPVLSRGPGPGLLRSGTASTGMNVYAGVQGLYESGLISLSTNEKGEFPDDSSYGVQGNLGAYGFHRWKRTILGLDYRGGYYHYTRRSYYDGSDHALSLGVTHQASKRTYFTLREVAGTTSRDLGSYSPYGFVDPAYAQLPSQELFNNRTYYLTSLADLTFQKSSRLSFNLGGTGAVTRRRSKALVGNTAAYARGDMMYRAGRNQTLGFDYAFTHYVYTRNFGSAFIHMGAFDYAARLGRYWTFSFRAGVAGIDSQGLIRVAIDPVIAVLIGRSFGVEIYRRQNLLPSGGVSLQRHFRNSSVSFSYIDQASPGNGLYLASRNRSAASYFSYTGIRRWNIGASFDYSRYSSLSRDLNNYEGFGGGVGASCRLGRGLHFTTRLDSRDYKMFDTRLARNTVRASVGLAYSSGEGPLALW